jgi:serine/threonine protein kinase
VDSHPRSHSLTHARNLRTAQIAQGMNYLHGRDPPSMHRDLKPENVLVTEYYQLKISDFGESKSLKDDDDGNMTVVGTPFYIAPEVARGLNYVCSCA